jgi:hypothetical protein
MAVRPRSLDRVLGRARGRVDAYRLARRGREEYKATWTTLGTTSERATEHVIGRVGETEIRAAAGVTRDFLERLVGIGRVGDELAPHSPTWIGCDVSPAMLGHAR